MTAAHRRLLARLRAVRGLGRPASAQARERAGDAVGAHVYGSRRRSPRPRRACRRTFDAVVQRAMAKDPAERYASAGELGARGAGRAGGRSLLRRAPVAAPPPPAPARLRRAAGRTRGRGRTARGRAILAGVTGLLAIAAVVAIVSLGGSDDPGTTARLRQPRGGVAAASAGHRLQLAPPGGAADRAPEHGRHGARRDDLGGGRPRRRAPRRSAHVEGYDPVINGWKSAPDLPVQAAPRDGRDVQGRAGRDGRAGYRRDRIRARWSPTRCSRCATGSGSALPPLRRPRAAGAAAVVGDKIVVDGRPGRRPPGRHHGGVRRQELERGGEHADAARAPRGGLGRQVRLRGGRARAGPRQELRGARALRPRPTTAGSGCPTCRPPAAGSGAAIAGGHLFAVGGESPTRPDEEVESYDIAREAWSRRPLHAHPQARARRRGGRQLALRARRGDEGPGTPAPWTTRRSPGSHADPARRVQRVCAGCPRG